MITANGTAKASWWRNGTTANQSNDDKSNDNNQKNALNIFENNIYNVEMIIFIYLVIEIIIRNGWYAKVNINMENGTPYAINVHPAHSIIVILIFYRFYII